MDAGVLLRLKGRPLFFAFYHPCRLVNPARDRRLRHKRPPPHGVPSIY
jgi:hypothetical protein